MNIGLTGGIATGKSTVAAMLEQRGAIIIDADQIAREVVLPGSPHLVAVAKRFGQAVISADGSLNRRKLGDIVFKDETARKDLEAILHPPIRHIMLSRMKQFETEEPERLVVVDIPLMYESNLQSYFTEVMLVYIPSDVQIARLMKRDGLSVEEAKSRLNSQLPIDEKKQYADIIIDNSGTIEETERQIEDFWQTKRLL